MAAPFIHLPFHSTISSTHPKLINIPNIITVLPLPRPINKPNFPSIIANNSSSGNPTEIDLLEDEDTKFVTLNPDDPKYGPPALLLLGFNQQEEDKIRQLLKNLEGEFLKVIFCTRDMINMSLWDAVNCEIEKSGFEQADSLPRICFLSGLSGEEMIMFIDAYEENSGLEEAVFAAVVPNSADKLLKELIDEIMADNEMVNKQRQDESMGV